MRCFVLRVFFSADGGQPAKIRKRKIFMLHGMPLSHKKAAQERKAEKKREIDRAYYQKNREKKLLKSRNVGK